MTPLRTLIRQLASRVNASGTRRANKTVQRVSAIAPTAGPSRAGTTPLGAVGRGLLAGAAGSLAMNGFFLATKPIMPPLVPDAFDPPDPEQANENPLETIARRIVEGVARRGPLSKDQKAILGNLLHYGVGARWGVLYSLARETYPQATGSPAGIATFAAVVALVQDQALLPLFRLAGPPLAYPAKNQLYGIAAHLVYGAATAGADELLARSRTARYTALGLGTVGLAWTALRLVGSSSSPPSKARVQRARPAAATA